MEPANFGRRRGPLDRSDGPRPGAWSVHQFRETSQQFYAKLDSDRAEAEKARLGQVLEAEKARLAQSLEAEKARLAAAAEAEKNRAAEQRARDETRKAVEADAAITRRIEAQKPFLEERLKSYFAAIRVAGVLTQSDLPVDSPAWKENVQKFFQFRWGELEMVGDAGIRNAARVVGQQLIHVVQNPDGDRHDLRWSVECLADELRYSLEHTWGLDTESRRRTVYEGDMPKIPNGCTAGAYLPVYPPGMLEGLERGRQWNPRQE
jgi:hypothetical protein